MYMYKYMRLYMYMHMYMRMYMCVCMCVYIYIYIIVPIADPELRQNQGCEPATVESATCADFGGNRPGSPGNRIFLGSGPGSWSKIPCQSRSV